MERLGLLLQIARIGNIDFQRRCVVNGTKEGGYINLFELIETTTYAAKHKATHPVLSKNLSPAERETLIQFHDHVDAIYGLIPWRDQTVTNADIVERDARMREVRDAANQCIQAIGISFTTEELMDA
jgi:hypothetical protein